MTTSRLTRLVRSHSRGWRQRIASAVLLVLVVLLLGTAVKAAYIDDSDHYYYCLAWSWWPWSGC